MRTRVVHCKKEEFDVYIGRPSKWGNPFSHLWGNPFSRFPATRAKYKVDTREEAVKKYREYLLNNQELMNSLHEVRGKVLGCWCKPKSCHGDVIAEIADDIL